MDHDQQTQLQSGIINVTVCVGAFTKCVHVYPGFFFQKEQAANEAKMI